jgi:hypothetical protein
MQDKMSSKDTIPQADKQAHAEIAERAGRDEQTAATEAEGMSSDETVPQADKQAHTDIAERAGHEGDKQP